MKNNYNICADVFEINCTYLSSFTSSPSHTTLNDNMQYTIITPAAMSKFMVFNREICPGKNWWAKGVLSDMSTRTYIIWNFAVIVNTYFLPIYLISPVIFCICLLAEFDHIEIVCLPYVQWGNIQKMCRICRLWLF